MKASSDELLARQIAYYRQRAAEYDEWFLRQGRYDHGEQNNARWFDEVDSVRRALKSQMPSRSPRILELACGTGFWTEQLCRFDGELTAVDASAEMIALNRERVAAFGAKPRYIQSDLFAWSPEEEGQFDLVFFSFWLSHVPPDRFDAFWALVGSCLSPGGQVFFVDSLRSSVGSARDQKFRPPTEFTQPRMLNDGRRFEVVKIYYQPAELQRRLELLDWIAEAKPEGRRGRRRRPGERRKVIAQVKGTPTFFLYGSCQRAMPCQ